MNDTLTIERLYDLRLGPMAEAFSEEAKRAGDPGAVVCRTLRPAWSSVSGRAREEGRLARRTKAAQLKMEASVEEVDFRSPRGLDRGAFLELCELGFLRKRRQRDHHRGHRPGQDLPRLRARRPGAAPWPHGALPPRTQARLRARPSQGRRQLLEDPREDRQGRAACCSTTGALPRSRARRPTT